MTDSKYVLPWDRVLCLFIAITCADDGERGRQSDVDSCSSINEVKPFYTFMFSKLRAKIHCLTLFTYGQDT